MCSLHFRVPHVLPMDEKESEWPLSPGAPSLSMRAQSSWISGAHQSLLQNRTPLLAVVLYCSYQSMTLSMHSLGFKEIDKSSVGMCLTVTIANCKIADTGREDFVEIAGSSALVSRSRVRIAKVM